MRHITAQSCGPSSTSRRTPHTTGGHKTTVPEHVPSLDDWNMRSTPRNSPDKRVRRGAVVHLAGSRSLRHPAPVSRSLSKIRSQARLPPTPSSTTAAPMYLVASFSQSGFRQNRRHGSHPAPTVPRCPSPVTSLHNSDQLFLRLLKRAMASPQHVASLMKWSWRSRPPLTDPATKNPPKQ